MSSLTRATGELARETARAARLMARREARAWKREIRRPWDEGSEGSAAALGRWIGLGLVLGAVAGGIALAVWAERPWES